MRNRVHVSAVIPAYNEERTIRRVIRGTKHYVDEVVVIDDGSTDNTEKKKKSEGVIVIRNTQNRGYYPSLRLGFQRAKGDIIVTLDADGQHDPSAIPYLIEPIKNKRVDLVIGVRPCLSTFSERVLTWMTNLCVPIADASSGFRAISRKLLVRMDLATVWSCTCGTFVLEAVNVGGTVLEIPIRTKARIGKRRINTRHITQFFVVLWKLIKMKLRQKCVEM